MLELLAQTTQEAVNQAVQQAVRWTADDWVKVIGAIGILFGVTIFPGILAIMAARRAEKKSDANAGNIQAVAQAVAPMIPANNDNPLTENIPAIVENHVKSLADSGEPK